MCKNVNCGCIAGIVGAVLGIIVGILFYLGTITPLTITTPIIIALATAGAVLLTVTILLGITEIYRLRNHTCLCANAPSLVVASIITIVAGTGAFAVTLITGNIARAILVGIGAAAFFSMLILLICWLICICKRNCDCIRD